MNGCALVVLQLLLQLYRLLKYLRVRFSTIPLIFVNVIL